MLLEGINFFSFQIYIYLHVQLFFINNKWISTSNIVLSRKFSTSIYQWMLFF